MDVHVQTGSISMVGHPQAVYAVSVGWGRWVHFESGQCSPYACLIFDISHWCTVVFFCLVFPPKKKSIPLSKVEVAGRMSTSLEKLPGLLGVVCIPWICHLHSWPKCWLKTARRGMRLWTEIPGDNAKAKKENQQIVCVCVCVCLWNMLCMLKRGLRRNLSLKVLRKT